jgi:dienelactone hydrolase
MKKLLMSAMIVAASVGAMNAQTSQKQIVEEGGTGPYKSEVVGDASCPAFTIYRPQNLNDLVAKQGALPVIVYANGACFNNNVEMRLLLSEVASYGYVIAAIGPYDEEDVMAQWRGVLKSAYPETKGEVIMANGEKILPLTPEEIKARQEQQAKQRELAAKNAKKNKKKQQVAQVPAFQTYPKMLLEVLSWLTDQNATKGSEYYHCLDLDHVAAMGQSCGGAQVLGVAHDPRIKTCVMLNSGIGDMEMMGSTKECLKNLHQPMFYMIGGPGDIAYANAQKDYERIADNIPVVMLNSKDGHSGTYYEKHGGNYAKAVIKWLDWQLKGKVGQSALFLDDEYLKMKFPDWQGVRKNF